MTKTFEEVFEFVTKPEVVCLLKYEHLNQVNGLISTSSYDLSERLN